MHASELVDITRPEWAQAGGADLPALTIVVPARNEEAELEPALRSLLAREYPAYEVIAVDDRSTDGTAGIMERLAAQSPDRLRVIRVRDLPPRWLGKTHAMWLAARAGSGEWLLFTDAHCVFHPEAVSRAVHYATNNRLDHVVLFPTAHLVTLGERMMLTFPSVIFNIALHRPCAQTSFAPDGRFAASVSRFSRGMPVVPLCSGPFLFRRTAGRRDYVARNEVPNRRAAARRLSRGFAPQWCS